jgi:hypothetical protein
MKSRLSSENERTGSRKRKNSESTAEHAVSGSEADSDDLAHRRRRVRARLAEDFVSIPLQGRTSLRELIPEVPLTVVEQLDKSGALVHQYTSSCFIYEERSPGCISMLSGSARFYRRI